MDLEQRVTMLEQEVQILKNQIQATLLDIQEHLLTNAYPSLRAEDDTRRPDPALVKTISVKPEMPEVPDIPAASEEPEAPPPAPAPRSTPPPSPVRRTPPARPVNSTPAASFPPAPANDSAEPGAAPFVLDEDFPTGASADTPITSADWALMEQLVEWTNRRVSLLGARRTRALIRRYTAEGRISPGVRDALLQIVAINTVPPNGHDSESLTITPAPSLLSRPTPDDPSGSGSDGRVSSNLVMRLIAGISAVGNGHSRSAKRHG